MRPRPEREMSVDFPAPVFAHQCVNLAGIEVEFHVIESANAGKGLQMWDICSSGRRLVKWRRWSRVVEGLEFIPNMPVAVTGRASKVKQVFQIQFCIGGYYPGRGRWMKQAGSDAKSCTGAASWRKKTTQRFRRWFGGMARWCWASADGGCGTRPMPTMHFKATFLVVLA